MACSVTYDELAAYASGECEAGRGAEIARHLAVCEACRGRMHAIAAADRALAAPPRWEPSAGAVLAASRAIARATAPPAPIEPGIMTLEEVGRHLRLNPEQLDEIVETLPAFEIAGQVRVRRQKLYEWIDQRERMFRGASMGARERDPAALDTP
ncbi:MAG: zf-HC2 domain-containing protein [Planctomycetes bacterium]|nr:zf-HC2 domain-containing protein [Planctomycetota bacterium]